MVAKMGEWGTPLKTFLYIITTSAINSVTEEEIQKQKERGGVKK